MSNTASDATQGSDEQEVSEEFITLLSISSAGMTLVAFTAVGYFLFPDDGLVYGAIMGLFAGIGTYLHLPWLLLKGAETDEQTAIDDTGTGGIHRGALGFGMEAAAVAMIASRFAIDDVFVGIGAGIAAMLVVYLGLSILLTLEDGE